MTEPGGRLSHLSKEERALLYERIRRKKEREGKPGHVPIEPRDRALDPAPLSFAQQRLWFLDRLKPGDPVYNISAVVVIAGDLDPGALGQAFQRVVDRHESLRTTFATAGAVPVQVVSPGWTITLPVVDLTALGEVVRRPEGPAVVHLAQQEGRRPFDLTAGPLVRGLLLRLDPARHVLVVTMHHIVSDGWSLGLLVQEIAAFYHAAEQGTVAMIPDLPIQYPDFAVWQRRWLSGEVLEKQLDYWRRQLAGSPAALDLPTDHPRPPRRTTAGGHLSIYLSAEMSQGVKDLARQEGITPFILFLAAFQALLHRWTGQEDLTVGTVIANRNRAEVASLIGFFVNTLVMRGDLSGDPSFRELLGRTRAVSLGAFGHQDVPFEKLVEELKPERDPSRTPLFQVMLSLQNAPMPGLDAGKLKIEPLVVDSGTAKFDLSLTLQESAKGDIFAGNLGFSTDLFEAPTALRLVDQLTRLLGAALAAPDRRLSDLTLLSAEERHQLTAEWNDTGKAGVAPSALRRFEIQAECTPEAEAVTAPGEILTYRELDLRATILAARLRDLGVRTESRVGLFLGRSAGILVGILGTWKAGGAWVPLDPSHPRDRLAFTSQDAGLQALVTESGLFDQRPDVDVPTLLVGDVAAEPFRASVDPAPGQAAYVLYTSGSTGTPKGAVVEHAALANYLAWVEGLLDGASLPAITSLTFDASLKQLLAPLLAGRPVRIVSEEVATRPAALLAELEAGDYTAVNCVPSLWSAMLDVVEKREAPISARLRLLLLGGQVLPPDLLDRTAALLPAVRVWNLYGPTESTANATAGPVSEGGPVSLGRPLSGARSHVLDRRGNLVPGNVIGELYLAGAGLARGYLGRPALTAERFVPDPFSGIPGSRLYRTGDLVRRLPDGRFEFRGRNDDQVKVRGIRVELGEIEARLARNPRVREAVVLTREEAPGDVRLVACVVPRDGQASADGKDGLASELKAWLRESLPEPMVPAAWIWLESLPLTPTGKPDRRALEGVAASAARSSESFVAPRTPTEELLAGLWSDVLTSGGGTPPRVGAFDDFFELGGHSLLATQLTSRIRETFGVDLPLARLFEAPTLAALAAHVEEEWLAGHGLASEPIRPVPRDRPLPLSFAQERLWFLDRLQPGGSAYNMPVVLRLQGEIRLPLMEAVLREVVRRHESLRTTFAVVDGEPVQVIAPEVEARLPLVDLADLPEQDRACEAQRLVAEEVSRPFDLQRGPLLRAALLRQGREEHVLLFNTHHIISDGWSMGVLVQEVSVLYGAALAGRPSPLPELPVQYPDFAVWQRSWLAGGVLERQMAYWRDRLAGAPPLDLPTDHPRPAVQSFRGDRVAFEVEPEIAQGLLRLSRRSGATLFMTLLAGFAVWLRRATGQDDLVMGTPIANRNRRETEGLIGSFVNTLVLRLDLAGDPPVSELLGWVRQVALEAYSHQDLPFERLVEELRPERRLSHNPLFQIMFALQNAPGGRIDLPGLTLSPLGMEMATSKFDLAPTFTEWGEGLAGSIEYSTDLFELATVQRITGHVRTLLAGVVADPEQRLSELPLLTEPERRQILDWGGTRLAEEARNTLDLFEEQAARVPDAAALVFEGHSLTYSELNRRAELLARRLRTLGVGPGVPVGLCVERSVDVGVGMLGIWKAGGGYVPFDPSQPQVRLAFLMEDSAVPVIVTQERVVTGLPSHEARTVLVDAGEEVFEGETLPRQPTRPEDLAYVIYTSGTTGRPKGVLVEHRNLSAALAASRSLFGFRPGDRTLCVAPFTFDIFLFELLLPLTTGGTSVLVPLQPVLDVDRLVAALGESTYLHAVPALMRQVVDIARRNPARYANPRALFVGGDVVPIELFADLRESFPGAEIWELYGPTEATILCTAYQVAPAPMPVRSLLGKPLAGARIQLRDRDGRLVPTGIPGEIWIGGAGVARGYRRREELTAEKFVVEDGERYYRSGDLARWLPDGNLEFLGRIDQQVKVRGFRIELGEIESVLSRQPEVREAVVVARDEPGGKRLVAYVVPEDIQSRRLVAELRHAVQDELPDYMVPSAFVLLEALPLTAHGKVDRAALPAPEWERPEGSADYLPPRTPTEEVLAGIWGELLGLERVGRDDNFFELGGHSLLATQVVSRLRDRFAVEVPVRALFEEPRLADLAREIDKLQGLGVETASVLQAPPLRPLPRDTGDLPLSFAQERMWFLYQLDPASPVYNMPAALRLVGRLDAGTLARALREVAQRHEALRTTFPVEAGRPSQRISPDPGEFLAEVDLRGLPRALREPELAFRVAEESRRPFDLASGPLIRATLLRLGSRDSGEDESALFLTLHHIVSDGWSMGVLVREVATIYGARVRGKEPSLQPLPIQYADFALWQRSWLLGEVLDQELAYWKEQLAGESPLLRLPTDRPRPAVLTSRGGRRTFSLPAETADGLEVLARREGATLYIVLLSGFQALLARYTGQEDIWVGSPVANRNRSEVEGLIGFFVNTLVLRGDLSGDPAFRTLISRLRQAALGAYAHQDVPFEKLVEELRPERDPSRSPLFQVMFALQNAPMPAVEMGELHLEPVEYESGASRFDLTFSLMEVQGRGIFGSLEYNSDLFDAATIDRLAIHFSHLLASAVADPDQALSALTLLGKDERQQLLVDWNDVSTAFPREGTLHGLFAAQVERAPEAPALLWGVESMTYRELAERASRLAHHLRRLGVGSETRVGICLPRSPEMLVGVMGVLLAGGAYVPLDPSYPQQRLQFMLEDSGAAALVTLSGMAENLSAPGGARVELDGEAKQIDAQPASLPDVLWDPDGLCYVIYTSGSTGRPKGVLATHRGVVNTIRATVEELRLGPGERFLQFASLSFDGSVAEIFSTFASGACLCLIQHGTLPVGEHLAAALRDMAVTVALIPPSVLATLGEVGEEDFPDLHTLNVSAEKCPAETVLRWAPGRRFLNLYGPTEASVYMTVWEAGQGGTPGDMPGPLQPPPIGRPIANSPVYIVDRAGNPVPTGVPGELLLGGVCLARGYLGRPARTAQSFVPDPFAALRSESGERLYRTGDLCRWRPDGHLEMLGRIDHQVKVRGFRIELGEIETALARHPGVQSAVVLAREDAPGDRRLVAYVVPRERVSAELEEALPPDLRAWIAKSLPAYMMPGFFILLDELPITTNGKIDRRRLPAPERRETGAAFVPPGTETEQVLARIWGEVLALDKVGANDNFFDLGGHSLLLTQVQARVREALGRDLPLLKLIEHSTVSSLAAYLEQGKESPVATEDSRDRARRQRQGLDLQRQRLAGRSRGR